MKQFPIEDYPLLIAVVVLALALVGWLVYRNFKDEEEFEENADNPKQTAEKHSKEDKT